MIDQVGFADVDQDGDNDLVILNQENGSLQVLENKGSENFIPLNASELGAVKDVQLSDLDQDGDFDVVYTKPSLVGWARNDGAAGLVQQNPIASVGECFSLGCGRL